MKLGYEPNHFANTLPLDHQICLRFEKIYFKTDNEIERDNLVFAFIRHYAQHHFDAFMLAHHKNDTLASYCQDPRLQEFWQTLAAEAEDIENDATVNVE